MRDAFRANRSLYIPSQSIGATEEEETRWRGEDVPLLLAAGADPRDPVPLAAAAVWFQWEQPGCGSEFCSAESSLVPPADVDWGGVDAVATAAVVILPSPDRVDTVLSVT